MTFNHLYLVLGVSTSVALNTKNIDTFNFNRTKSLEQAFHNSTLFKKFMHRSAQKTDAAFGPEERCDHPGTTSEGRIEHWHYVVVQPVLTEEEANTHSDHVPTGFFDEIAISAKELLAPGPLDHHGFKMALRHPSDNCADPDMAEVGGKPVIFTDYASKMTMASVTAACWTKSPEQISLTIENPKDGGNATLDKLESKDFNKWTEFDVNGVKYQYKFGNKRDPKRTKEKLESYLRHSWTIPLKNPDDVAKNVETKDGKGPRVKIREYRTTKDASDTAILYIAGFNDCLTTPQIFDYLGDATVFAVDTHYRGSNQKDMLDADLSKINGHICDHNSYTEDLDLALALIQSLDYGTILIAGHSFGGLIAINYLRQNLEISESLRPFKGVILNGPWLAIFTSPMSQSLFAAYADVEHFFTGGSFCDTVHTSGGELTRAFPEWLYKGYDLCLKPIRDVDVTFGFANYAIQAQKAITESKDFVIPNDIPVIYMSSKMDSTLPWYHNLQIMQQHVANGTQVYFDDSKEELPTPLEGENLTIFISQQGKHDVFGSGDNAVVAKAGTALNTWLKRYNFIKK